MGEWPLPQGKLSLAAPSALRACDFLFRIRISFVGRTAKQRKTKGSFPPGKQLSATGSGPHEVPIL
jgi:hypothetical protein